MRACVAFLLLASPACAETVLSEVTGNWAAPENNGFYYRAALSGEGSELRLKIWQGMSPEGLEGAPALDNRGIAYAGPAPGDRQWLEVTPSGALQLSSLTEVEGYLYAERLTLSMMDFQFTVMAYEFYNNPFRSTPVPADPFQCFTADCYSCVANVWDGTATAAGAPVAVPQRDFEAINAALWTPDSIYRLGFCPAPN